MTKKRVTTRPNKSLRPSRNRRPPIRAPNRYVRTANKAADSEELSRRLKEEGFKFIMYVPREAKRLNEGWGVFHFSDRGHENWTELESKGLESVFEHPGRCVLSRIL